jgi:acyl-CoA synthetase (AMP-forming)/AMP-acid ligase II
VAVVAASPMTVGEVQTYCKDRLAIYKVPEHVVFVNDLPYSETGKVVRRQLVELIQSELADK